MHVTRLRLINWRNFPEVDAKLEPRVFIVGPNASGKSNLLDVFRFLKEICLPGGGLQKAVMNRGGFSKLRCLSARGKKSTVTLDVELSEQPSGPPTWRYSLVMRAHRRPNEIYLESEQVWKEGKLILNRPDKHDKTDAVRLTQTHMEQLSANLEFREISKYFQAITYLHLVPQLLRHREAFAGPGMPEDPFGRGLLERVASTKEAQRARLLKKIEAALQVAVPQLKELSVVRDSSGVPHLQARYEHWRPQAGRQQEDQFSDGTLRLFGLLWSLVESDSLLLLEEPELSLHPAIVKNIPSMITKMQRKKRRQTLLSTHSQDLLSDPGISGEEILLLQPHREGTRVSTASSHEVVRRLLQAGLPASEAILSKTAPPETEQLTLF